MTNRTWQVDYTLPGQTLQKMTVQATDVNTARKIVQTMFAKAIVGYIRELK